MSIFNKHKKKIILAATSIALVSALAMSPLRADTGGAPASPDYLQQIAHFTYKTMAALNNLPQALESLTKLALVFTEADDGKTPDGKTPSTPPSVTPIIQSTLTGYSSAILSSLGGQIALQNQVLQDMFGPSAISYADELSYQTLMGIPYSSTHPLTKSDNPASGPAYNYLKNASGMNIIHAVPSTNWKGLPGDQQAYLGYYNTVTAVESFNAYVLSQVYTDAVSGSVMQVRNSLLKQASDPAAWLVQMASEDMGYVFREMLIYIANIYVMLSEMLNIQKEMVTAQSMTNTLLVLTARTNEQLLLQKAKTPMPGSR